MRISDWSSDVCSSDLAAQPVMMADAAQGSDLPPLPMALARALSADDGAPGPEEMFTKTRPENARLAYLMLARWAHDDRSEEHTSELQSLMRISYAVFCLNKKKSNEGERVTTEHKDTHNRGHRLQQTKKI